MSKLLLVGSGGFLGAGLRYLIYSGVLNFTSIKPLFGTTIANLLGCLLGGIAFRLFDPSMNQSNPYYFFFVVGFLGSLTTLSAFAGESTNSLLQGNYMIFGVHFCLNAVGCIAIFLAPILLFARTTT